MSETQPQVEVPAEVTHAQVQAAVDALGLPWQDIVRVEFGRDDVAHATVVRAWYRRRSSTGVLVSAGARVALTTVEIAVV